MQISPISTKVHIAEYKNTEHKIIFFRKFFSGMVIPSAEVVAELINKHHLVGIKVTLEQIDREKFMRGGSGKVLFINEYAIKRSSDEYGNSKLKNEARCLAHASASVNRLRPIGFTLNLP